LSTNPVNYELYCYDECPFCLNVLSFLNENNLLDHVTLKNTLLHANYKSELIEKGGKPQVPCLIENGNKVLYESQDIINYLKSTLLGS